MFVDVTIKVTDSQGNALSGVKVDIRAGRDSAVHYTDDNASLRGVISVSSGRGTFSFTRQILACMCI